MLYLDAWLRGAGFVPLYNLLKDAATAEISRVQVWQWIRHGARLEDGCRVTAALYREIRRDELRSVARRIGRDRWAAGRFDEAAALFDRLIESERLEDFLTIPAYDELLRIESAE